MGGVGKLRVALVQMMVTTEKSKNLEKAASHIQKAAEGGAKIVALPECFNSPYGTQFFKQYAEPIPGESTDYLSALAKKHKIFLIGGSIPEILGGKYYNTCTVFNPEGNLVATHRKMHLFDIDIPGKITFKESETLSAGNSLTTFETPYMKVGVGICYDLRFAEMAQIYTKEGCKLLVYPGAFNMTTGPAHWELLTRARAVDNQLYVGVVSPARDEQASYIAWGHSTLCGPWGDVNGTLDEKENILLADLDLDRLDEIRNQIPISNQRRPDIYSITKVTSKSIGDTEK